ncbi:cupin domain-containing protein [Ensifer sp. HO-A22]|uniref:Cupin domain-containing protein n=1 Tax=Ensifer oleiphilus TaxID=2742698 RepID=A0A7Y6QC34_9HYPH|nr:cupin domain-containing protein [Ensifer oleiphilus]NVD42877.1 cupin domain-containing protein [Ensifer oleiphilus]
MSLSTNCPGFIDILGPQIRFLTPYIENPNAYCVIDAVVPAGVQVPLHSHGERETLVILAGKIEAFKDDEWLSYSAGDVLDIPSGVRHAIRNSSGEPVNLLMVTYESMRHFFQSVGVVVGSDERKPNEDRVRTFVSAAIGNGYWLGSEEDNRAIGLGA